MKRGFLVIHIDVFGGGDNPIKKQFCCGYCDLIEVGFTGDICMDVRGSGGDVGVGVIK